MFPDLLISTAVIKLITMKKVLVFVAILTTSYVASAQVNPHALGIRLYGGALTGAELSYQDKIDADNRFELDLSAGFSSKYNRLFLVGVYHWVWNLDGGFNWYAGPGASFSFDKYKDKEGYLNIGIGGQLGLEYDFVNAPILISVDVRPMWDFVGDSAGFGWGAALGFRFTW
jgi:hypothetical protein